MKRSEQPYVVFWHDEYQDTIGCFVTEGKGFHDALMHWSHEWPDEEPLDILRLYKSGEPYWENDFSAAMLEYLESQWCSDDD